MSPGGWVEPCGAARVCRIPGIVLISQTFNREVLAWIAEKIMLLPKNLLNKSNRFTDDILYANVNFLDF